MSDDVELGINDVAGYDESGVKSAIDDLEDILLSDSDVVGDDSEVLTDFPHWEVDKEEFIKALSVVMSFPVRATVFLGMWVEMVDGFPKLRMHSNNKDIYVDLSMSILNKDSYYDTDRVYFVDCKSLYAFVRSYSRFVLSFDEDGNIHYQSNSALYKLDNYNLNLASMRLATPVGLKYVKFPLSRAEIGVFKALFGFAFKASDTTMLVKPNGVEAFFTLYKYDVDILTGLDENVIIRKLDIPTLHEILYDDEVYMACSEDRIYYRWALGEVSMMRVPYQEEKFIYPETFATGEVEGEFSMDIKLIRKALKLISVLKFNRVEFIQSGNDINIMLSESRKFVVGVGSISKPFSLVPELLAKIVNTMSSENVAVQVKVAQYGIDLVMKSQTPVKFSLSKVTEAQHSRKEKIEKKLENREKRVAAKRESGQLRERTVVSGGRSFAESVGVMIDAELGV